MIIKAHISKIRNVIYFDYKKNHPFVMTLRQYKKNHGLIYSKSKLYEYYNCFNPVNASQVLFETDEIESLMKFGKYNICYPWLNKLIKIKGEKGLKIRHGCQYFGRVSNKKGLLEFNRLIKLFNKIRANGYKQRKIVSGYLLKKDNDYRVIVLSGNHRMAIISALKNKYVKIKIRNIITLDNIDQWPMIVNNVLKKVEAEKIFNRFFYDTGKNKFERIELMSNKKVYQAGAAIQKWDIIKEYLDKNIDKTLLDVGCNYGYNVKKAIESGMEAIGIEANEKYIDDKLKDIIKNKTVTPTNIRYIRNYDVVLLLSVNHQWNCNYGREDEEKMIKILGNKAKHKFFFQPASIRSKYKMQPNIIDNNGISIRNYNLTLLKKLFPNASIKYIGKSKLTTKKEPYRYIFLVEKNGD